MNDCEKDKKMIIILSVTCGFLLLFLLISVGINYKQNSEKNDCSSNLNSANNSFKNFQSVNSSLQNVQSLQDYQKQILESEKDKVLQLYYVINSLVKEGGDLTKDQINCMINKLFEKYTPFDIVYNLLYNVVEISPDLIKDNPQIKEWVKSSLIKSIEIKKAECQAVKSCNFPNSSDYIKSCNF